MKLHLNATQRDALLKYLNDSPDAEQLGAHEYVADFYDVDTPLTINILAPDGDDIEIVAAAQLLYSEEQDGWYMGARIEDETVILNVLAASAAI